MTSLVAMNNEYLSTIRFYASRFLSNTQLQAIRSVSLYGVTGLRRWLASRSLEAFIKLYFPSEFTLPLAPIHHQMLEDMQAVRDRQVTQSPGLKLARAIPRNHSKSTYYSRILPLHGFLYGWSTLTVLLGNNDDSARRMVGNIKTAIETNPLIAEDFPTVKGNVWGIERLENKNGRVITGYGVGSGAVRGISTGQHRPSLVILDDIDDEKSVRSAVELANNIEWFDKSVSALGDNVQYTTSYIAVGTIIRKTSLLQHILNSADYNHIVEQRIKQWSSSSLWEDWQEVYLQLARDNNQPRDATEDTFYQAYKTEMLEGTAVLWDKPDDYYYAMVYKLAHGEKAFNSEMQNNPQDVTGAFKNIRYIPLPDESGYQLLAALDPTTTGNKTSDLAAFVEVLFHPIKKEIIVSYVDAKQRSYSDTIDDVVRRIQNRGKRYSGLWVETNSAGNVIQDLMTKRFAEESIMQIPVGIYNSIPKAERIDSLSYYINNGQLLFTEDLSPLLYEELNQWPMARHDDILDALATIIMYLKQNGLLDLYQDY